jgi:hypothetical protein
MSYIIPNTSPFISTKLTQVGREKLAKGALTFKYWAIGDSEINYDREEEINDAQISSFFSGSTFILRPVDIQPDLKSFITTSSLNPLNEINDSNIYVVKAVVNNEATERGFFSGQTSGYTTLTSTTYSNASQRIQNTFLTGGTSLSGVSTTNISVGDLMLLKLVNQTVVNYTANTNSIAIPNMWYRVQSIGPNTVVVDRNLPNYSGDTNLSELNFYIGGEVYNTIATGNTSAYWDSGTLSFDSDSIVTCSDTPVWNMNNVWCESLAGMTGLTGSSVYEDYTDFGSYRFLGQKNPYLDYLCQTTATTITFECNGPNNSYPDEVKKSIGLIHYTNNTISNLYGEFLFIDNENDKTFTLDIPDLLYHRRNYPTGSGTTSGMKFIASGSTQFIGSSDIEYVDLIEDPTFIGAKTPKAIGRVFPQLKIAIIDDDELVAALSYKSNRNWTLPELSAALIAPTGGTSTGALLVGETMYLTYSLSNESYTGLTTTLPCQNYTKITNTSSSAKDVSFKINDVDLLPYMRKLDKPGYDGLGFNGYKLELVYQVVQNSNDRPLPGSWKKYDFTSTAITTTSNTTIDPTKLELQNPTTNGFVLDSLKQTGSTIFDITQTLSMQTIVGPQTLQFGDERFFYGNVSTYIGATIFKTIFNIQVSSAQYNVTSNPTRSKDLSTNPPDIRVSEIGIYDSDSNLVIIGKLSMPIALTSGRTIICELSLDF